MTARGETTVNATPALLRELRSLRLRFAELAKEREKALAAEKKIHEEWAARFDAEKKLARAIVACLKEVSGDKQGHLPPQPARGGRRSRIVGLPRPVGRGVAASI